MSSSLSAAFFASLKGDRRVTSVEEPSSADDLKEEDDETTDIVKNPYAAALYADSPKGGSVRTHIEARSKETVAAVERMRERLSAMGIIGSASVGSVNPAGSPSASPVRPSRSILAEPPMAESYLHQELFMPPPPPFSESNNDADDGDKDTASTTSGGSGRGVAAEDIDDALREEIVQKTKKCNDILM